MVYAVIFRHQVFLENDGSLFASFSYDTVMKARNGKINNTLT